MGICLGLFLLRAYCRETDFFSHHFQDQNVPRVTFRNPPNTPAFAFFHYAADANAKSAESSKPSLNSKVSDTSTTASDTVEKPASGTINAPVQAGAKPEPAPAMIVPGPQSQAIVTQQPALAVHPGWQTQAVVLGYNYLQQLMHVPQQFAPYGQAHPSYVTMGPSPAPSQWMQAPPNWPIQAPPSYAHPVALNHYGYVAVAAEAPPGPVHGNMQDTSFPDITAFLDTLDAKSKGARNLASFADVFKKQDIFQIDELAHFSADQLVKHIGLSYGNAAFLLSKAAKEVVRLKGGNAQK